MTFSTNNFYCGRGVYNSSALPRAIILHTYISDTDAVSTIIGGGYFPAYFGQTSDEVIVDDTILIRGTDGSGFYKVTNAEDSTLTLDNIANGPLDYEVLEDSLDFTGAATINNVPVKFVRIADVVHVRFTKTVATISSGAAIYCPLSIPIQFRPPEGFVQPASVWNNGDAASGSVSIDDFGIISFYNGWLQNFSGTSVDVGINTNTITYLIN